MHFIHYLFHCVLSHNYTPNIFPYFTPIATAVSSTYDPDVLSRCSLSLCPVPVVLWKSSFLGWGGASTSQACCRMPVMISVWCLTITWAALCLTGSLLPHCKNVRTVPHTLHIQCNISFYEMLVWNDTNSQFLKPLSLRSYLWWRVTSPQCLWTGATLSLWTAHWENLL